MSLRDVDRTLRQMRDHAVEAVELAAGREREDLDRDRVFGLALVRLVEIVGEAARRVPQETRRAHPAIPWAEMTGMRDRLIHGYDRVDHRILWEVVTSDLPQLVSEVEKVLASD